MERANDLSQLALKLVTRADERRTEDDGSLMTHRDWSYLCLFVWCINDIRTYRDTLVINLYTRPTPAVDVRILKNHSLCIIMMIIVTKLSAPNAINGVINYNLYHGSHIPRIHAPSADRILKLNGRHFFHHYTSWALTKPCRWRRGAVWVGRTRLKISGMLGVH